jgi:hypothetical protein
MKLLDQRFNAIRYDGTFVTVYDIKTLIKDTGFRSFILRFGLNHGIKPYNQAMNEHEESKSYYRNFTHFGDSLAYTHEFVIENMKGNIVCPFQIVHEYLELFPKEALYSWQRRPRSNKKYISRHIGYYPDCNHRMLKARAGVVKEDGEMSMKKWNFAFSAPYDDSYAKRGERNWKHFRKNQYR